MALPTITVDGVDICAEYGLIWTNDSTLSPPEARLNLREVPGMDGSLDLTETLTDDVVFGNRKHELVFFVRPGPDFESVKTEMCNFLHGRLHDYVLSVDPDYTYRGRWECDSYFSRLNYREIKFTVTADPWKRGPHMSYVVKGAGGTTQRVVNGRRRVIPVITVQTPTIVMYDADGDGDWEQSWELGTDEPGSYTIDGLRLRPGTSSIYVNSAPDQCDTTWEDLDGAHGTWGAIGDDRWSQHFITKTAPPTGSQYSVVIEYDIQDL